MIPSRPRYRAARVSSRPSAGTAPHPSRPARVRRVLRPPRRQSGSLNRCGQRGWSGHRFVLRVGCLCLSVAYNVGPYACSLRKIRDFPAETECGSSSLPVGISHTRQRPSSDRHSRGSGNPETFVIEMDSRFRGNDGRSFSEPAPGLIGVIADLAIYATTGSALVLLTK